MFEIPAGVPIKYCGDLIDKTGSKTVTIYPDEIGIAPGLEGCRVYVIQYPDSVEMGHFYPEEFDEWKEALTQLRVKRSSDKPVSTLLFSAFEKTAFASYKEATLRHAQVLAEIAPGVSTIQQLYSMYSRVIVDFTKPQPEIKLDEHYYFPYLTIGLHPLDPDFFN